MTPVLILAGCVVVIGAVVALYKRGAAKTAKAQETAAGPAKQ
jgi:hypothetical protein